MVVLSHSIRIEANLELKFLLRSQHSFIDFHLENTFFFDLIIFQEPIHIFLINIADGNIDILWVASVRFGYYLSLEVDN